MTSKQFVYWLQGFAELTGQEPTMEQWKVIRDHLQTVFVKITPVYSDGGVISGSGSIDKSFVQARQGVAFC